MPTMLMDLCIELPDVSTPQESIDFRLRVAEAIRQATKPYNSFTLVVGIDSRDIRDVYREHVAQKEARDGKRADVATIYPEGLIEMPGDFDD